MAADYEDRVVLFLDILAFRELIKLERQDVVAEALSAIAVKYNEEVQISSFSDSVAISIKIAGNCELLKVIQISSFLVWLLLHKGVLSRGAISVGKLHHRNGILFGPALIDAYEHESQVALYPRVILQKNGVENFLAIHGDHKCVCENEIRSKLISDTDGWQYVHIMSHKATIPIEEILSPAARTTEGDAFHQILIESKVAVARRALANTPPTNLRAHSKHQWMTRYIDHYENAFNHAPRIGALEAAVFAHSLIQPTTIEQISPNFRK